MRIIKNQLGKRRQDRIRGVLPVRLRGKDSSGVLFESLAHTLDLTPTGVRLGAIRHELRALDTVVVLFRKRRIEFTVMWTKMLGQEYQVGLQSVAQEGDPWGLDAARATAQPAAGSPALAEVA
jgi:hypothetical protein